MVTRRGKRASPYPQNPGLTCLAVLVAATSAVSADVSTVTLGGSSPQPFPTNTGSTTYVVLIDDGNPVNSSVMLYGHEPILGQTQRYHTIDALKIDAGDELRLTSYANLTLLQDLDLNGTLRFDRSTLTLPHGQGLAGAGEVRPGELGGSAIRNAGGTFTIGNNVRVEGSGLIIGSPDGAVVNLGSVIARTAPAWSTQTITLSGTSLTNTGSIVADGGTVVFDVPFTRISDLGNISHANGGRFRIGDTLDNAGRTFTIDDATGDWELGGTIRGGTVTSAAGRALHVVQGGAAFDAVTLDGEVRVAQYADLKFDNMPQINGRGALHLDGDAAKVYSTAPSLVIGPDFTVVGHTSRAVQYDYGIGGASRPTLNKGRLVADKVLQVNGSSFTNEGHIEINPDGVLAINTPLKLSDLGGTIDNRGAIRILGTLDNTGRTFTVPNELGKWELGGTIRGGTIETPGGGELVVRGESGLVTLDDVRVNGTLRVSGFAGTVRIPAGQTLSGTGSVIGELGARMVGERGLTIGPAMTVRGRFELGEPNAPLLNRGTLVSEASGAIRLVGTNITNLGTIEVRNGSYVSFAGRYKWSDLGTILNNNGGFVRLGDPFVPTTLDLTGQVLEISAETGKYQLMATIQGGTIRTEPGHELDLYSDSVLDGVHLDGATLRVHGKATIADPLTGAGEIVLAQGADPGMLTFSAPKGHIPSGVTVRDAQLDSQGDIGDRATPLLNQGTIRADFESSYVRLLGTTVTNGGTLRTARRATVAAVAEKLVFEEGGTLAAVIATPYWHDPQPPLVASGDLDLATTGDRLELTLDPAAALHTPYELARYFGTLTGVFDHVTPGFTVDYSTPGVIFVTAVPEPTAGSVFVLGAASLLHRVRRRRKRTIRPVSSGSRV
jgi:hypothetical protein